MKLYLMFIKTDIVRIMQDVAEHGMSKGMLYSEA
jgi:hypothetical protein